MVYGGKFFIYNNFILKGNDWGIFLLLRGSDVGGDVNNVNFRLGDNIINGKNGKKINVLFLIFV